MGGKGLGKASEKRVANLCGTGLWPPCCIALKCLASSALAASEQAACLPEGQQVVLIVQGHGLCSRGRGRQK